MAYQFDRERMLAQFRQRLPMAGDVPQSMSTMVESGDIMGGEQGGASDEFRDSTRDVLLALLSGGAGYALRGPSVVVREAEKGFANAPRYKDAATKLWEGAQNTRWGRIMGQRAAGLSGAPADVRRRLLMKGLSPEDAAARADIISKFEKSKMLEQAQKELARALAGRG